MKDYDMIDLDRRYALKDVVANFNSAMIKKFTEVEIDLYRKIAILTEKLSTQEEPMTQETPSCPLRPISDRIIATRIKKEEKKGALLLPGASDKDPFIVMVVAVGNGKITTDEFVLPMEVEVGDKVLIAKYSGQEVTVEGNEYIVLKEDDVIAIVNQVAE